MYELYKRLMGALEQGPDRLMLGWDAARHLMLSAADFADQLGAANRPIPHRSFERLLQTKHGALDRPGLYVWGAWSGDRATIQYIGIVCDRKLRDRFRTRYVNEWNRAAAGASVLRALPEAFSPNRESVEKRERRYLDAGLPDVHGWSHRLQRAERYAKIGLENLWYFLIPAPGEFGEALTGDLGRLERHLVQATNAALFAEWPKNRRAIPLLNKTHFSAGTRRKPNPYAPQKRKEYEAWLGGEVWWSEWDRQVATGFSGP